MWHWDNPTLPLLWFINSRAAPILEHFYPIILTSSRKCFIFYIVTGKALQRKAHYRMYRF
jgi:hypothetical protein